MDDPIAYFLTWTTYGSWLPGDARGWVTKPGQFMPADAAREAQAAGRMRETEFSLDADQRHVVEKTVAEHCRHRRWPLHAVNCRRQHVHVVVTAPDRDPEVVLDQFKAWCTRRLRALSASTAPRGADGTEGRRRWWTEGGSKRRIFDEAGLVEAIRYVNEGQDGPR